LEVFSDALRRELLPWGLKVISIEPGSIATPIWDSSLNRIDKVIASLPPRAHELYGDKFEIMRGRVHASERRGLPPETVAKAVYRALTARNPKTRYQVGFQTKVAAVLVRFVPDKVIDWFVKSALTG
jgi:short-subunit dehydrogenase